MSAVATCPAPPRGPWRYPPPPSRAARSATSLPPTLGLWRLPPLPHRSACGATLPPPPLRLWRHPSPPRPAPRPPATDRLWPPLRLPLSPSAPSRIERRPPRLLRHPARTSGVATCPPPRSARDSAGPPTPAQRPPATYPALFYVGLPPPWAPRAPGASSTSAGGLSSVPFGGTSGWSVLLTPPPCGSPVHP